MGAKNNNLSPGADVSQLVWLMALFTSMKTYRATVLDPSQHHLVEKFLQNQLREEPDYITRRKRVHLLSLQFNGPEYRQIINELSPDRPEDAEGKLYVWITIIYDEMHVVMINKNVFPRKNKSKGKKTIEGKPATGDATDTPVDLRKGNLKTMEAKLQIALSNESYEEAAQLRDAIRHIQDSLS